MAASPAPTLPPGLAEWAKSSLYKIAHLGHRPACKREEKPCQLGAVHTWHIAMDHILIGDGRFRGEADMPRASGLVDPARLTDLCHRRPIFAVTHNAAFL
jgi:hypothetical protein